MVLPVDLLEVSINREISILLKDGRMLTGKLSGYDQYMNIVMEDVMEKSDESEKRLGRIVVRGSNIVSISLAK
ncbi:MAG TPA: RNA-binding protein [Thermoplasmatales archaeon]|jgi:small nuclear ribonucleoprotein|nr:RNA-binding protein [Thermoplasmata archaeon]HHO57322.1 RNA-binding protein [Thermoplasmatales archaeon]